MVIIILYLGIYLICINILAITLCVYDKLMAKMRKMRVKELSLMLVSAIGGSFGMLMAMHIAHHKTRKPLFRYGVPGLLILHIAIFILLHKYL